MHEQRLVRTHATARAQSAPSSLPWSPFSSLCLLACACRCLLSPIFYRRKKVQKDLNEAQAALDKFEF